MKPSHRDPSRSDPDVDAEPAAERPPAPAARKVILERRARFLAAALAGAGIATSTACDRPQVCLEAPMRTTTSAPVTVETAEVCLEVAEPPPEAGAPSEPDAGAATGASGQRPTDKAVPTATVPKPRVCLSPARPKPPQPCLSVRPPNKTPSG